MDSGDKNIGAQAGKEWSGTDGEQVLCFIDLLEAADSVVSGEGPWLGDAGADGKVNV